MSALHKQLIDLLEEKDFLNYYVFMFGRNKHQTGIIEQTDIDRLALLEAEERAVRVLLTAFF